MAAKQKFTAKELWSRIDCFELIETSNLSGPMDYKIVMSVRRFGEGRLPSLKDDIELQVRKKDDNTVMYWEFCDERTATGRMWNYYKERLGDSAFRDFIWEVYEKAWNIAEEKCLHKYRGHILQMSSHTSE